MPPEHMFAQTAVFSVLLQITS